MGRRGILSGAEPSCNGESIVGIALGGADRCVAEKPSDHSSDAPSATSDKKNGCRNLDAHVGNFEAALRKLSVIAQSVQERELYRTSCD